MDENIVRYDDLGLNSAELEELRDFLVAKGLGNENLANLDISEYLEAR